MLLAPLALLAAQVTPVQPIVKGTGLPLQGGGEEAAVMATVEAVFAGLEASDAAAIRARLRPDGGATVAGVADGTRQLRHLGWDQWLATIKPDGHRYRERFTGQPAIEIDGDIAMVWGDFTLSIDGKVARCGVDHFDLVRDNGAWRVQNVTWSQRPTGCPAG